MILDTWRCWQCGGSHAYVLQRCPNAGVTPGAQPKEVRMARWLAFLATYEATHPGWVPRLR